MGNTKSAFFWCNGSVDLFSSQPVFRYCNSFDNFEAKAFLSLTFIVTNMKCLLISLYAVKFREVSWLSGYLFGGSGRVRGVRGQLGQSDCGIVANATC